MATRRVYRGIEEAALLGTFEDSGCPHTFLARRLRWLYREICDFRQISCLQTSITASVYGNPALDAKKGYNQLRDSVQASVLLPYLGRDGNQSAKLSEEELIKVFTILNSKFKTEEIKAYDRARNRESDVHVLGGGELQEE